MEVRKDITKILIAKYIFEYMEKNKESINREVHCGTYVQLVMNKYGRVSIDREGY